MENSKKGYTPMMEKPDYRKISRFQQNLSEIYWTAVKTILKAVDWKSAKQSTTTMSPIEAEYIVATEALMEEVWTSKIIDGLGGVMPLNKRPMEMLCNNEHALDITIDPVILKGSKHFQRKYHYIREVIQEGEIILKKVYTYGNVADPFTKPMPFNKHFEHDMAIGIVPASSPM
nr:hypothetical protein [Tanacetum cinerariifolium]